MLSSDFNDEYQETEDTSGDIPPLVTNTSSDVPGSSSVTIDHVSDSADETSDASTTKHGEASLNNLVSRNSASDDNVTDWHELITEYGLLDKSPRTDGAAETGTVAGEGNSSGVGFQRLDGSDRKFQTTTESDATYVRDSAGEPDSVNSGTIDIHDEAQGNMYGAVSANTETRKDLTIVFQSEERHKLKRVIDTLKQRLETAKADTEDLISRLNQELAVRQFLSTKV